eukprot:TRINITY_DN11061_c0_g1_i1.p1 TRINITY_DN11061_c0_g1~~TRINITY_DN11061_c0_g1_i1.p1  ORF type:complete len:334 (+),score=72.56 TRINITY_DN11061_c0_g1_i1:48-1049(+)
MPRGKKRAPNTADQSFSDDSASNTTQSEISMEPQQARLKAMVDEFDIEVEQKCRKILHDSEGMALSIRSALTVELMRLPKKISSMTMREFFGTFQGDVEKVQEGERQKLREALQTPGRLKGTRSALATVYQSPDREVGGKVQKSYSTRKRAPPSSKKVDVFDDAFFSGNTHIDADSSIINDVSATPSTRSTRNRRGNREESSELVAPMSSARKTTRARVADKVEFEPCTPRTGLSSSVSASVMATPYDQLATPGRIGTIRKVVTTLGNLSGPQEANGNMQVMFDTEEGDVVNIADEATITNMVSEDRAKAMVQLQMMKENLSKIMDRLKSGAI